MSKVSTRSILGFKTYALITTDKSIQQEFHNLSKEGGSQGSDNKRNEKLRMREFCFFSILIFSKFAFF